jgi:hypothetical protein
MPWRRALLIVALALFVLFMLTGCGTQTDVRIGTKSQAKTVTKEVIRETPLANGGKLVERTLTTDQVSDENTTEKTTTGLDASTNALAGTLGQVVGAAVAPATGGLGGGLVELGVTAAVTALLSGYGAAKHAQARQLREERDFHKDDAEKGWQRALAGSPAGSGAA